MNDQVLSEIENNKNHGERSLVFNVNGKKIYVKTWSDIFTEHEINLHFLQEKLLLQHEKILKANISKSAKDIIDGIQENSAIRPAEMVV